MWYIEIFRKPSGELIDQFVCPTSESRANFLAGERFNELSDSGEVDESCDYQVVEIEVRE